MAMGSPMEWLLTLHWERESYPRKEDFLVLPFFVLFFFAARFLLDRFLFERVARRLILREWHSQFNDTPEVSRKIKKFKESGWKCVYFLSAVALNISVTHSEPWFTNTRYFWVGPGDQIWPDQTIRLKLQAFYMYAAGFYTYSIFALLFWETRRSDFVVSMIHHIVSVVLIVLSYISRFARVGSIVLAIHDANDVFLEVGKMSKYSGQERLASFSFILFSISWILLRLTIFPLWIIRSTCYEVLLSLDMEKHKYEGPIYYFVFNTLLFTLLVINIYWAKLIYGVIVRQIRSGDVGDVRSESEGEDEHED